MTGALPAPIAFLIFAAGSFMVLRFAMDKLMAANRAAYAGPLLGLFGALSGAYFYRLGLHTYFIWHLVLFSLVIFSWHARSRADDKRLAGMRTPGDKEGRSDKDVAQTYEMTRRLLSFGLVSYLAAFAAAYYYLFSTYG